MKLWALELRESASLACARTVIVQLKNGLSWREDSKDSVVDVSSVPNNHLNRQVPRQEQTNQ